MTRMSVAAATVVLALYPLAARAQGHEHPAGAPSEQLGTVHFATSCSPRVAPQFDRAVALLHSFEFGASIRGFNDVLDSRLHVRDGVLGDRAQQVDQSDGAGDRPVALLQQGRQAASAAVRLGDRASERERGYIGAVSQLYDDFEHRDQRTRVAAYERAMNDLVTRQPADTEAMIFHALSLTASASPADKTYANQLKAGAILESLWVKQPNHPGLAHYIIHSYDYPPLANKARAAALRYASIAPRRRARAAHALAHVHARSACGRNRRTRTGGR